MKIWDKVIGNQTEIVASMPHWYARVTVVDLKRAKLEDGMFDFSKASTHFVKGDEVMFIPCNNFDQALIDSKGQVFKVKDVTPDMHYSFEQSMNEDFLNGGLMFVVKYMYKEHLTHDEKFAMVPVTIEMINHDRETTKQLREAGLKQPGWYKWRSVDRTDSKRAPMISCELVVSIKKFHSPDGTSSDAGETFQPDAGLDPKDGVLVFDPVDGSITLG